MPIVSNTSPILNLAIIGELQLLRAQFGEILIPEAVLKELRADEDIPGSHAISEALNESWIQTSQLKQRSLAISLQRDIDKGESEAIALTIQNGYKSVLLDERDGRKVAKSFGIKVVGAIGVLLLAWRQGELDSFKVAMDKLREKAGFYIRDSLYDRLIEKAGDGD